VFLVDDHPVVTEGLRLLLEAQPDLEVVGTAAGLAEATAAAVEPSVLVVDLVLGADRGSETVRTLRDGFPRSRVLVLTMVDDPRVIQGVLAAGAHGYMLKEAAPDELVEAVRRVARGEEYLQPAVGVAVARTRGASGADPPTSPLTDRERHVARLLALGHTNAEIASLLDVSERTIETHRAHLLEKLGVRTRAQLVRRATELGLVEP
jgi:two-component system response regulator NreC